MSESLTDAQHAQSIKATVNTLARQLSAAAADGLLANIEIRDALIHKVIGGQDFLSAARFDVTIFREVAGKARADDGTPPKEIEPCGLFYCKLALGHPGDCELEPYPEDI